MLLSRPGDNSTRHSILTASTRKPVISNGITPPHPKKTPPVLTITQEKRGEGVIQLKVQCSGLEEGGIALGAFPTANRPPGVTCKTLEEVWFIPRGIRSFVLLGGLSSASCWVKKKMAFQTSGPERLFQASRSGEMELARESHFNMLELSPTGVLAPGIVPKDLIWPIPSPFRLAFAPLCFGSTPRKIRRGRSPLRGPLKCSVTEG